MENIKMPNKVSDEEIIRAKKPHDLFLVNLIGNHILIFIATLGMASSWVWPMFSVPIISFGILGYIIIKGHQARKNETEFVAAHWQIAIKRSLFFIKMIVVMMLISAAGVYGYMQLGWMKEAVYALIGGGCILPIMVTTLVLILMESDAMHRASLGEIKATKSFD